MGIRVLLVEDDEAVVRLAVGLLAKAGITEVEHTDNGTEAIRLGLLGDQRFDVALVDWSIPGKDGLTVLKTLRAAGCEMPVFMISAESREGRVREAIEAGATDYFVKPLRTEVFLRKMRDFRALNDLRELGSQYRVKQVMNPSPVTIGPDATVRKAIALLTEQRISGLPVVDAENRLLGDVSEYQLIKVLRAPEIAGEKVEKLMTRELCVVDEETLLPNLASLILERRLRRVPVVRDDRLAGIVSRHDLLRYAMEHEETLQQFAQAVRSFLIEQSDSGGYVPQDLSWVDFLPQPSK